MPKVRYHDQSKDYVEFKCPGCLDWHIVNVNPTNGLPAWSFNHDLEKPTFSPSLLVRTGHYVPGQSQPPDCPSCNCQYENGDDWPFKCGVCHSFIRNGNIEFLSDCTHENAGKTLPIDELIV